MPRRTLFKTLIHTLSPCAAALLVAVSGVAQAQGIAEEGKAASAPALPSQELTPQVIYNLLLAEVAGARGRLDVATMGYMELARSTRDPRLAKRASELAVMARRGPEALEATRLWNELDPASEAAVQTLTGLMVGGMGTLQQAEPLIARQLAQHADQAPGALMSLNRVLVRYRDKAEVLAAVERLSEPYLKWPEAYYARAQAALAAERADAALDLLTRALELKPDWDPAALFKAQLLHQQTRTGAALDFVRRYLQANPKSQELRYTYARLLVVDKQYPASRAEFEKLVAAEPERLEYVSGLARLLEQAGDKLGAEQQYKRALALDRSGSGGAQMQLALFYEAQQRHAEAIEAYRLVEGEQQLTAQTRAALLQAKAGDLAGARAALQRQRAQSGKDSNQYLMSEAQLLRELGQHGEAFALLGEALKQQPEQAEMLYDYALLAEKLGKPELMERSLRRVIKLKPEEAQAYNALGYSLAERNVRLDEAKALIEKALKLAPDDGFILDSMGWVLYRSGDLPAAVEHLRRAYAVRADPEIAAHLGEVLWMQGLREEAIKTWEAARKEHPENDELTRTLKRFQP